MHTGIDFLHSFFFFLQCNPLFISLSPCHWVRGENQLAAFERTQWIQHERRLPNNLDLFSFICYLSATTALLQSIILLCVGCMCRYACARVCAVRPSVHTNTPFSTGHLTHFSVWITILQPIIGRQNGECWKKTLHPACHTSESQPCLSTERGRDGERGKESEIELVMLSLLSPSFSLYISTTQGPVKPLPTHPSPQLKVVLRQWLRFLHSILRKGQNWQRAICKAATNEKTFIIPHYL